MNVLVLGRRHSSRRKFFKAETQEKVKELDVEFELKRREEKKKIQGR